MTSKSVRILGGYALLIATALFIFATWPRREPLIAIIVAVMILASATVASGYLDREASP